MVRYMPVPGLPRYMIGDDGSVHGPRGPRKLCWYGKSPHKYMGFTAYCNGRHVILRVAVLVLTVFIGGRPPEKQACHRDDNRANNRLSNLYWGTPLENAADRRRNGGYLKVARGEAQGASKITEVQARAIYDSDKSVAELTRLHSLCRQSVWNIKKRRTWKHIHEKA